MKMEPSVVNSGTGYLRM